MKLHLLLPVTAAALLAACAGMTDVVPIGQDVYMVASHGTMGWSSGPAQKASAYQKAAAFCQQSGKQLDPISDGESPSGFGRIASGEVKFRCVAK